MSAVKVSTIFLLCFICFACAKSLSEKKIEKSEWNEKKREDEAEVVESEESLNRKRSNIKRYYVEDNFWKCVGKFNNCLVNGNQLEDLLSCHQYYVACADESGIESEKDRLVNKLRQ